MTEAIIANSIRVMRARRLVDGDDAAQLGIGAMTDARWRAFFDMTVEAGLYPADLDYRRGYTLRFVNRRVGMWPHRHRPKGSLMTMPKRLWQEMTTRDFATADIGRWIAVLPVAAI